MGLNVEILDGLFEGERVIYNPSASIEDGILVSIKKDLSSERAVKSK